MDSDIQSKPTRYHHIFTRARGEARWANCFDALCMPYEYEAEDTWLAYLKKRYLPDFYLTTPAGTVAAEIKGRKTPLDIEVEKCEQLCKQREYSTLLLNGLPYFGKYQAQLFYIEYDMLQCKGCQKVLFFDQVPCPKCGSFDVGYYLASKVVRQCETAIEQSECDGLYLIHTSGLPLAWSYLSNALQFAFRLASHARFEYLDNWKPSLFDGECIAFNPAFSTQGWDDTEMIYNALEGVVTLETVKWWVECGFDAWEYRRAYEHQYHKFRNGGMRSCLQTYNSAIEAVKFCLDYSERELGADRNILDAMDNVRWHLEEDIKSLPVEFLDESEIRQAVVPLVFYYFTMLCYDLCIPKK